MGFGFKKKLLYFTRDSLPSPEEYAEAERLMVEHRANVGFRVGTIDPGGVGAEKCDLVAGTAIPEAYAQFPRAEAGGTVTNAVPEAAAEPPAPKPHLAAAVPPSLVEDIGEAPAQPPPAVPSGFTKFEG
jgi:hypothetical protein